MTIYSITDTNIYIYFNQYTNDFSLIYVYCFISKIVQHFDLVAETKIITSYIYKYIICIYDYVRTNICAL